MTFDPLHLFHRITLLNKGKEGLKEILEYECTFYPLSLFDEKGMRKTTKSDLYSIFEKTKHVFQRSDCHYVIDGGFLLHCVVWPRNQTFGSLCDIYCKYIGKHYGNVEKISVVLDG